MLSVELDSKTTHDVPEENSYARLRRISNMDNSQVQKSVYINQEKDENKQHSILPLIAIILFGIFYMFPIFPLYPLANTCFSILILASFCWGTEIIPSYITAYLVAVLSVWFRIGFDLNTGLRIPAKALASRLASRYMDPVILVFLGSLTLSLALTKLQITDRVSTYILKKISPNPKIVLLTIMCLNYFISSFLSNVASTTLALTFSFPIIRSLDPDDPFIKGLLFGLAWSGNAGGLPTTISSPQNILAIKYINDGTRPNISFLQWVCFAGPPSFLILLSFWIYLLIRFPSRNKLIDLNFSKDNNYGNWTWKHSFSTFITFFTILLWSLQDKFVDILGHVGITSLIPVISFFSTGILNNTDFGSLRWSTLVLMGGGLALGESMSISGLLDLFADIISKKLQNFGVWTVTISVLAIEGVLTSVINHTSAAAILFPVLNKIGEKLNASTQLLTLSAIMISASQMFHISSFPNALISGVQRHSRLDSSQLITESFLNGKDFFIKGWPTVIISLIIISTIGYGLIHLLKL